MSGAPYCCLSPETCSEVRTALPGADGTAGALSPEAGAPCRPGDSLADIFETDSEDDLHLLDPEAVEVLLAHCNDSC